mgnify:FL=1
MNKKEDLRRLLKGFSKEEILDLLSDAVEEKDEQKDFHTINNQKNNKRRGKGSRKRGQKKGSSSKRRGGNKGKACRVLPLEVEEARPNRFEEFIEKAPLSQSEKLELEEAAKEDKKNKGAERSPRSRQSSVVEVECRICGEIESVSSAIVNDASRWKCNSCAAQACE